MLRRRLSLHIMYSRKEIVKCMLNICDSFFFNREAREKRHNLKYIF